MFSTSVGVFPTYFPSMQRLHIVLYVINPIINQQVMPTLHTVTDDGPPLNKQPSKQRACRLKCSLELFQGLLRVHTLYPLILFIRW